MVAAAAKLVSGGIGVTASAIVTTRVLNEAGANPMTRSPTANPSTPAPIERTMPAHSSPKVGPAKPSISASSGQQSHRPHHVAKVEARGVHLDFDLAGPDGLRRPRPPNPSASSPPGWRLPNVSSSDGRPTRRKTAAQPKHMTPFRRPDDLVSGCGAAISAAICRARSPAGLPGKVEQADRKPGISLVSTRAKLHSAAADEARRFVRERRLLGIASNHPKRCLAVSRLGRESAPMRRSAGRPARRHHRGGGLGENSTAIRSRPLRPPSPGFGRLRREATRLRGPRYAMTGLG